MKPRGGLYLATWQMSPLARGRGLKHALSASCVRPPQVAPRAGAWIETITCFYKFFFVESPLARGRGLKPRHSTALRGHTPSPLARGRGLKLKFGVITGCAHSVAPRAGAWIETYMFIRPRTFPQVAPRAGAWIETRRILSRSGRRHVAPRAGAWIETPKITASICSNSCRPSRGGVD